MKKAFMVLLGLLLIAIVAFFCFMDKSTAIQKDLQSTAETLYKSHGLQGVHVGIKGEGLKQTRILTLEGEVISDGIKKKAEELASNIDGITGVENNLVVHPLTPSMERSQNTPQATTTNLSACQKAFKEILDDHEIHFAYNQATIRPTSYPLLDRLIHTIKRCPHGVVIVIEGHTDADGQESYNQRLSEMRANAVKTYLIQHGIEASRLNAIGYGEKRPVADNRTQNGKEKNRRIEFRIKGVNE